MIITINSNLQWDNDKPLQEQTPDVQAWYGENIQAKMAYRPNNDGIQPTYDANGRPTTWHIAHEGVEACIQWQYEDNSTDWRIKSGTITLTPKTQA